MTLGREARTQSDRSGDGRELGQPSCRPGKLVKRGCVLAFLAVALTAAALAPIARADGDPASDYLAGRQVFLSSQATSPSTSQRALLGVVDAANRSGFAIRVAIISSEYDLGSITELWRKPRIYARFLGLELSLAYEQRLLVVMPNGFGFNWPKHSTGSAYRTLARVPIGSGDTGLLDAAQMAVRRLAAADGITVSLPTKRPTDATATARANGDNRIVLIAAALAALAGVLAGVLGVLLALRRRGRTRPEVANEPSVASRSSFPIRLRWSIPGFALLLGVAAGAPIVALKIFRHTGAGSGTPVGQVVTSPPFTWPSGRRPAPEFVLRDQHGRRVSLAHYRGRAVIVTFVDPLCRNLCPLEAKVLNAAVDQLPASQRPEILAVSVDVYANARANLLQDVRKWELVPQWHWAVGRPSQLAAVWKRYKVGVSVTRKKIAGATIHYITHSEAAYIVDVTGHERALFLWPFYPQDVEHTLRELT
jgi:cytochrome oxidase Cu insertion factor (SCO1/SenC/PrrC family)